MVANRNATMLTLAATYAAGIGAKEVLIAPTREDYDLFPDCRPNFYKAFNMMLGVSQLEVRIKAPYLHKTKREVVLIGKEYDGPLGETWSCYENGRTPCGECLACTTRATAIDEAALDDDELFDRNHPVESREGVDE